MDSAKGGGGSYIYLAGQRIAQDHWVCPDQHTVTYFHADALGSPVATTDAAKNVLERTYYAPYGEALNRSVDGPGYTGHVMDAATGLVYAQQRYYDPVVGRFLSIDPVAADPNTGGNFNRYWYANNNPYRFTDPTGRLPDFVKFAIGQSDSVEPSTQRGLNEGAGRVLASEVPSAVSSALGDRAGSGAPEFRVTVEGEMASGPGISVSKGLVNSGDSIDAIPVGEGAFAGVMVETTVMSFQLPDAIDSPIAFKMDFEVGLGPAAGGNLAVDPGGRVDVNLKAGVGVGEMVKTFSPKVSVELEDRK